MTAPDKGEKGKWRKRKKKGKSSKAEYVQENLQNSIREVNLSVLKI